MLRILVISAAVAPLLMAAGSPPVEAVLQDGTGAQRGTVMMSGGRLTVKAKGLIPGVHGVHLHEAGVCQGPDFTSAGAHWNPMGKQHGRDNPMGVHAGDLPNMTVNSRGRGTMTMRMPAEAMAAKPAGGLSLVVHAAADDYKTDPSGNSGARIGCAVLMPPA